MIRQITDPSEKALVSRTVLEALRDWFEVDESREYYIRESRNWPFFAAFDNGAPAGFLCLKETGKQTVGRRHQSMVCVSSCRFPPAASASSISSSMDSSIPISELQSSSSA